MKGLARKEELDSDTYTMVDLLDLHDLIDLQEEADRLAAAPTPKQ